MKASHERYEKEILEIISKELPSCRVYLFGSRAVGDYHEGSDIDLGLETPELVSPLVYAKIREKIEDSTLPVTVDLVDMKTASPDLLDQIRKTGIVWKN